MMIIIYYNHHILNASIVLISLSEVVVIGRQIDTFYYDDYNILKLAL